MDKEAYFKFSAQEGSIEISGSTEFVEKQILEFKEFLKTSGKFPSKPILKDLNDNSATKANEDNKSSLLSIVNSDLKTDSNVNSVQPNFLNDNVFEEEEGKIIIKCMDIGEDSSQKTLNLTLLLLYSKQLTGKSKTVTYNEIRDACRYHSCLESNSFPSSLTSKPDFFLIEGKKTSPNKTVKLTRLGEEAAKELYERLSAN